MKPLFDQRELPDTNNCYGQIWSGNIGDVCSAALESGPWTVKRCDRSGYDGHWRLHLEMAGILDLESDGPLNDGSYLMNGCIVTGDARGQQVLSEVSGRMTKAGIPHCFELYNTNGDIVWRSHHLWPEDKDRPDVPLWH